MITLDKIFDDDAYDDFELKLAKISKPSTSKAKKLKARRGIEDWREQKRLQRQIEDNYFDYLD